MFVASLARRLAGEIFLNFFNILSGSSRSHCAPLQDRLPSQPLELISRIRKHWAPRRGQSRDLLGNPGILDRRGSVHAAAVRLAALAPSSSHSSKGSTIPPRRDARRPLRILLNRMVNTNAFLFYCFKIAADARARVSGIR